MSEPATIPTNSKTIPSAAVLEAIAATVAVDAAATVRSASSGVEAIGTKTSHTDVVTELDIQVERSIRDQLQRHTPGASILGEEHGAAAGSSRVGWIVDPIDGTVNLIYGLPTVGVSIAATIDGKVVAGAVIDVERAEVFSASVGAGAKLDGSPIAPSSANDLAMSLIATGFAYDSEVRASEGEVLQRVLPATRDIRCFGSTAMHLCWVACGRIDACYQHNTKLWDYAAGALIAAESGALTMLPENNDSGLLLATTPHVFHAVLELVRR